MPSVAGSSLLFFLIELVAATHGRGMYVVDAKPLQQIAGNTAELAFWGTDRIRYSEQWGERRFEYLEPYEPSADYLIYAPGAGKAEIEVKNEDGIESVIKSFRKQKFALDSVKNFRHV